MDGIIDGIFGWFGKDKAAELEELRLARLRNNSQQTPVIAQRPVAPIKEKLASDSRSGDDLTMTSMSDDGGILSSTSIETPQLAPIPKSESIEDLAMLVEVVFLLQLRTFLESVPHVGLQTHPRSDTVNPVVRLSRINFDVRFRGAPVGQG